MSEIERVLNIKKKRIKKLSFLSKLWKRTKNYLRVIFPKIYKIKEDLKRKTTFSGWGMTTNTSAPPWKNKNLKENIIFQEVQNTLISKISNETFQLTQFYHEDADYKKIIEELQWRHYIVFNSILKTLKFTGNSEVNLVECGVCDGLTVNFAMAACEFKKINYKSYLYDAWEDLSPLSEDLIFDYKYLDVERTKLNLKDFSNKTVYNKGFIPDIFKKENNPQKVHWLHIDLNSNQATKDTLEFFYNKIVENGLILFDDYGGFEDTREIIDNFFYDKKGHFINLPTGQGIFYKKN
jgi:O-methyltransferase